MGPRHTHPASSRRARSKKPPTPHEVDAEPFLAGQSPLHYLLSSPAKWAAVPIVSATLTVERETGHPQQTGHAEWVVELLTLLIQSLAHSSYRGESAV